MISGHKNWSYDHIGKANAIVHVFLPTEKTLNSEPRLKQKLSYLQQVECNNHIVGGVINLYSRPDTSWLTASINIGYRYACVWFDGCYPANDEFNMQVLDDIDEYNRTGNWFVAGNTRGDNFDQSMFIVNLHAWKDLTNSASAFVGIEDIDATTFGKGWINLSKKRGFNVPAITDKLDDTITTLRPQTNPSEFIRALEGNDYDNSQLSYQANLMIERIFAPDSPVFFVNTENTKQKTADIDTNHFMQYVGPTAGFKLLYYAYKYGIEPGITRFVFFDFDEHSCQFKRDTLAHWNGEDYVAWVDHWCEQNPSANTDLKDMVSERWPKVIDQFGGKESWLEFWNKVKQCETSVVQCDLINDHASLFAELYTVPTLLWTSNIYSYIIPVLLAKPFQLEKSFMELISNLSELSEDSWFTGTDINDTDLMCPVTAVITVGDNSTLGFE